MGDRIVVPIDPLVIPASLQSPHDADAQVLSSEGSSSQIADICTNDVCNIAGFETSDDEQLVQKVECRFCQEEDSPDKIDTPCACWGTIKFAHRRCVQRWCNEKGDTICEICRQPYKPNYRPYHPEVASNSIRTGWTISQATLDLHDPQTLAIAALEHHVLEAEHDDYVYSSMSGIGFFQFIGLIFILFRAAAFVLPFYLMARTIRLILTRRQRQLAAAELEFMLPAGQHRGLQFATSPVPALLL